MKPSFLEAAKSRWQIIVSAALAIVVGWLVHDRLPATITGRGTLVVPAMVSVTVFAVALLLLRRPGLEDEASEARSDGSASPLQGVSRLVYACMLFMAATWLVVTPLMGAAGSLRIAVGVPALLAPGFLLSLIIMPQEQGVAGRLLLSGVLSAGIIPLAAAALNLVGIPFSPAVALASVAGTSLALGVAIALGPRIAGAAGKRSR